MASNFSSSFNQTSDLIHDFACSLCKDDGLNSEAHFCCDECKKIYCKKCIEFHSKLFRTHVVLGKQDVSKWVGYVGLSPLEACDKHGDKKLELLCEDHDELCCHICVSLTHRMCQNISLISDEAKGCRNWKEFKKVQTDVREMTKELKSLQDNKEKNIKFLEKDEKKMLTDIKSLRKKNNDMFDTVEKGMIQEMDSKLKEHGDALQEDKSRCKTQYDKLETYLKNMESNQVNTSAYMAYKKCKDEMKGAENLLKEMSANPDVKLAFQADPGIEEVISRTQTLGKIFNQNDKIKVRNLRQYNVKIKEDKKLCCITGICELPEGKILITDHNNCKVKLLDSQFHMKDTCHPPSGPRTICHIDGNKAAVPIGNKGVCIITVAGYTLSISQKLEIPHYCLGISHHNGTLYVGSETEIYQYTMSGQLVKKIPVFEDNSAETTVDRFTVSRDGSKIYIPASYQCKLITIDTRGNILSMLHYPDKVEPR
ncbi:uncharacterized protein LOC128215845 [Mya arenaria]|uniref:uncharacterized protein LOC128215845 n=1 Tax=Mya arenaria TaxID=6604 RepID=UPI0022E74257|nr:uncharacterized protein LOC128215845 [Mya arenaria]